MYPLITSKKRVAFSEVAYLIIVGEKTEVTFSSYPDGGEGSVTGTTYQVRVDVWGGPENALLTQDSTSKEITIYKPIYEITPIHEKDLLFVGGYLEISKHTYDSDSGYMSFDYSVNAYHCGEEADGAVSVITEYKASFPALPHTENKDGPTVEEPIKPETGEQAFSDSDSIGTTLDGGFQGKLYDGQAYVRLIVSGRRDSDNYLLTNIIQNCIHP